jgi:hypothetical protein
MIKFMKFDSPARASFLCVQTEPLCVFMREFDASLIVGARDMRADADQDECHGKIAISARGALAA